MCVYIYICGKSDFNRGNQANFRINEFFQSQSFNKRGHKNSTACLWAFSRPRTDTLFGRTPTERERGYGTPMVWTCGSRSIVHLPWKFSISAGILWNVRKRSKFRKGSFNESMIFPVKLLSMPLNLFNSRLYNILANFSNCVDFVIK